MLDPIPTLSRLKRLLAWGIVQRQKGFDRPSLDQIIEWWKELEELEGVPNRQSEQR